MADDQRDRQEAGEEALRRNEGQDSVYQKTKLAWKKYLQGDWTSTELQQYLGQLGDEKIKGDLYD